MKPEKKMFFLLPIFLILLCVSGCKPGTYDIGGYSYTLLMPKVTLPINTPKTLGYAYIGVENGTASSAPKVDSQNPLIEVLIGTKTTERPSVAKDMAIYSISVKDMAQEVRPEIITNMSIPLATNPIKIMRGAELNSEFGLYFNNGSFLNIKPKQILRTPIMGQDDLLKVPHIKGIVARVICDREPIIAGDILSVSKEPISIWRFPIQITTTEPDLELNQLGLVIKSDKLLWFGPSSDLFLNPVIERDLNQSMVAPQDGLEFLVQNVLYDSELEIMAPPKEFSLPGVDFFLTNKFGEMEFNFGEKNLTLMRQGAPQNNPPDPKFLPFMWGGIKR